MSDFIKKFKFRFRDESTDQYNLRNIVNFDYAIANFKGNIELFRNRDFNNKFVIKLVPRTRKLIVFCKYGYEAKRLDKMFVGIFKCDEALKTIKKEKDKDIVSLLRGKVRGKKAYSQDVFESDQKSKEIIKEDISQEDISQEDISQEKLVKIVREKIEKMEKEGIETEDLEEEIETEDLEEEIETEDLEEEIETEDLEEEIETEDLEEEIETEVLEEEFSQEKSIRTKQIYTKVQFCSKCGNSIDEQDLFCKYCGIKFKKP